jgi:UDP-N-acetylmuramoyl-tripeptide--D-alanyl-D-alanine ligase
MNCVSCKHTKHMGKVTAEDIIKATGGKMLSRNADVFAGLSIDSRTIQEGELFVALKGHRFDGHDFLKKALETGSGAIVDTRFDESLQGKTIIQVHDTLEALQKIARYMRLKSTIPIIGVTGSNGKTTTKELIALILGTRYRVLKNRGNLNNNIGLPLSLAGIQGADEIGVLEMGASAPGEIKDLCEIALPQYGVLTNISAAHLEGFKDIETVRRTKLELLAYTDVAVVNADDAFLMEGIHASGFKGWVVRYGIKNYAEIRATRIRLLKKGTIFHLRTAENISLEVRAQVSGMFNIYNILAAASIGYLFNIDPEAMRKSIDSFAGIPMRLEIKDMNGIKIISDVYNANPASMECALQELARIKKGRTIAVLGDMLELGNYEEEEHRQLGRLLQELSVDIFIAVGERMVHAAREFKGRVYDLKSAEAAGKLLREIYKKGDTVLIKGSRGMNMERVLGG